MFLKNCNLIAHSAIKIINFSLIKNYGGKELCHDVLFSKKNLHKDGAYLLMISLESYS